MWPSTLELLPLRVQHRAALGLHLLSLDMDDRYARFGMSLSDEALLHWVAGIRWQEDHWWGAWCVGAPDLGLLASLQLAPTSERGVRELALTVCRPARGQGVGMRLLRHALAQQPSVRGLRCHHAHPAVVEMLARLAAEKVRPMPYGWQSWHWGC